MAKSVDKEHEHLHNLLVVVYISCFTGEVSSALLFRCSAGSKADPRKKKHLGMLCFGTSIGKHGVIYRPQFCWLVSRPYVCTDMSTILVCVNCNLLIQCRAPVIDSLVLMNITSIPMVYGIYNYSSWGL